MLNPNCSINENNKPTQWRVSILKGNKRLESFNVLAFRTPNGVLPTWFYGPGDSKKREIEKVDTSKGMIKVAPAAGTVNNPDIASPIVTEPQKLEEKKVVPLRDDVASIHKTSL